MNKAQQLVLPHKPSHVLKEKSGRQATMPSVSMTKDSVSMTKDSSSITMRTLMQLVALGSAVMVFVLLTPKVAQLPATKTNLNSSPTLNHFPISGKNKLSLRIYKFG
jgi:hypothetical protein